MVFFDIFLMVSKQGFTVDSLQNYDEFVRHAFCLFFDTFQTVYLHSDSHSHGTNVMVITKMITKNVSFFMHRLAQANLALQNVIWETGCLVSVNHQHQV